MLIVRSCGRLSVLAQQTERRGGPDAPGTGTPRTVDWLIVLRADTTRMSSLARRARQNASGIVSVLVTGIWLAALLLGFEWWLPFMLFGYIALIPIVSMLFDEEDEEETTPVDWETDSEETATTDRTNSRSARDGSTEDALETLRDRYARGELTDDQFERKLERLLETETLEDAEDRYRRDHGAAERTPETETER